MGLVLMLAGCGLLEPSDKLDGPLPPVVEELPPSVDVGSTPLLPSAESVGAAPLDGDKWERRQIRDVVRENAPRIKACYERALKGDATLEGKVTMAFTIEAGRVTQATVSDDSVGDEALAKCLVDEALTWRFEASVTGEVIYPFVFTPSTGDVQKPAQPAR